MAMIDDLFEADPGLYFDTASGPLISDIVGPPIDVLDTYTDGTPIAEAQSSIASAVGGGKHTSLLHRGDVQALAIMIAGAVMLHAYLSA